jgi:hypothetical protein
MQRSILQYGRQMFGASARTPNSNRSFAWHTNFVLGTLPRNSVWICWRTGCKSKDTELVSRQHLNNTCQFSLNRIGTMSTFEPVVRRVLRELTFRSLRPTARIQTDSSHCRSSLTARAISLVVWPQPWPSNFSMARKSSSFAASKSTSQANSSARSVCNEPANQKCIQSLIPSYSEVPGLPSQTDSFQPQARWPMALPFTRHDVLAHCPRYDASQD